MKKADRTYALSGELEGRLHICILRSGANTVGRGAACDIRLEMPGVSHRHAAVDVRNGVVTVRDLASKNGTFVRGKTVSEAIVEPGDEIRFGPSVLRLEDIDPEDAWLGISARREGRREPGSDSESGTSTVVWTGDADALAARRWLRMLEDLAGALSSGHSVSLEPALGVVVRGLEGAGGVLVRRVDGAQHVVLASSGELPRELPEDLLEDATGRARKDGNDVVEESLRGSAWLAAAGREGSPVLLLASSRPFGELARPLVRVAQRIFALAVDTREEPGRGAGKRPTELHYPEGYLPGASPAMTGVYQQMAAVAHSQLPVLLVGETGVGKECLARTLHQSSSRAGNVFLPVNCAAIPSELLEAELFGINKGVATGVDERRGRFSLADRGTLFLDEIGDMSLALQAKLLRVLEEGVVRPVGGGSHPVDVRIVAATNTHLEERVRDGSFRRDLFYRLAGVVVVVPPLRQRRDDIPGLIERFFHEACDAAGKNLPGITYGALQRLATQTWPGNVRQLRHVVHRLVFLASEGRPIDTKLADSLGSRGLEIEEWSGQSSRNLVASWEDLTLASAERLLILEALERASGNKSQAARLLGISRQSLHRRLVSLETGQD